MIQESNDTLHEIDSITFGISSSSEIIRDSVCEINNTKKKGYNTIYDPRMGSSLENPICETCNEKMDCPGHFGHIKLNEYILHPLYMKHIYSILLCVCFRCSRFILSDEQLSLFDIKRYSSRQRLGVILEIVKKYTKCCHKDCEYNKSPLKFSVTDSQITLGNVSDDESSVVLDANDIFKIFDNISDDTSMTIGLDPKLAHPRNFVFRYLPILPPVNRPYVKLNGTVWDDDITVQYMDIIKINNQIHTLKSENEIDKNQIKLSKLISSLNFRILTTFNNSQNKAKHTTNGRPIKGIKERLTGKEGQIRNNMMGKRSNQTGRTVIGPDPTLKSGEIAIPYEMAGILTLPVIVNDINILQVQKLVDDGKVDSLVKKDGKTVINIKRYRQGTRLKINDIIIRANDEIKITDQNKLSDFTLLEDDVLKRHDKIVPYIHSSNRSYKVENGMKVNRYLQDGDIVLLNRQPTLHKGSMMAMSIKIRSGKTIRMNLAACKSYNADFDGDEMNLHVPQNIEAMTELIQLSTARNHIISGQSSKPNMTIVQDSLLGVYKMTIDGNPLTRSEFMHIVNSLDIPNLEYKLEKIKNIRAKFDKDTRPYMGKDIISLFLPDDLYYENQNDKMDNEPVVKIYDGVFYEGVFDKAILGSSHNSLIHVINKEYGKDMCMYFIDCVQFSTCKWLLIRGFSIGFGDCLVTNEEKQTDIKKYIDKCYMEADGISMTTTHKGVKETRINSVLNKAKDVGLRIAKESLSVDNNFLPCLYSGSKGDFFNITQITGLLGQQNLGGQRIKYKMNNGTRSLPYYPFDDMSSELKYESSGFVHNSFINGLNPKEFFFHAMSGREGMTDTAMGTATSGYIQRRIVKLMEDIKIEYDGTVRDSTGRIYQISYGINGYDPIMTTQVNKQASACNVKRIIEKINRKYEGEK